MCRLLFLLGSKNKKELVENFLSKSVGEVKSKTEPRRETLESKTEGFETTVMEEKKYLDGFGFVWLNSGVKKEDGRVFSRGGVEDGTEPRNSGVADERVWDIYKNEKSYDKA